MRQTHAGGDKLFVDYAGDTVPVIIDRLTGEIRPAQIFVAVLGASNFTYAEASWTQALADWIGAHTRAFEAIGGVPKLLVPDNTKVAVIKACLYEPQVNRTYAEMAAHYDTAILPARPRRPRDKAKVEAGGADRRALAARPAAPSTLLQPGRTQRGDRRAAAPAQRGAADPAARRDPPAAARRTRSAAPQGLARASPMPSPNGGCAGSASITTSRSRPISTASPIASPAREVEVRLTPRTVEVFLKGERIAAHLRSSGNHRHTTVADHMPSSHRRYADWTVERIRREAAAIGPATAALVRADPGAPAAPRTGLPLLSRHRAPGAAVRRRSSRSRGDARHRDRHADLRLGALDPRQQARSPGRATARPPTAVPVLHPNIRGPRYYH